MRLIEQLERVNGYFINDNEFIWQSNKIYYNRSILYEHDIDEFHVYKNSVVIINTDDSTYINIGNKVPQKIDNVAGVNGFISETELLYSYPNEYYTGSSVSKYNLMTKRNEWTLDAFILKSYFSGKMRFGGGKSIYNIDTDSGYFIWQYNLSELGTYQNYRKEACPYEVKEFLGVFDNLLWVEVSDYTLLALDIKTGKLVRSLFCQTLVPGEVLISSNSHTYHLDKARSLIVWLSWAGLYHIYLKEDRIDQIQDYCSIPSSERWSFRGKTLVGDKMYFTALIGNESRAAKRVGVMDVNSGEILWHVYLADCEFLRNGEAPQVVGNRLYVNSTNGNLYIFEKEEYEVKDV